MRCIPLNSSPINSPPINSSTKSGYSIRIVRSARRKTLSLQVRADGQVLVRAPQYVSLKVIEAFVRKNTGWLDKHLEQVRKEKSRPDSEIRPLTMEEIRDLAPHLLLHAWSLTFYHPVSNQKMTFRHDPPFSVPVKLF